MELEPTHTASSSSSHHNHNQQNTERTLRSSTRVRAALKEKEVVIESEESPPARLSRTRTNSNNAAQKRPRDLSAGKGKGTTPNKRTRRATFAAPSGALTINEPTRDPKGKKRAAPETTDEDEAPPSTSAKKLRSSTSAYSLRSRNNTHMPKKPSAKSTSTPKGKAAMKGKATVTLPGPSSRLEDDDMMDVDYAGDGRDDEDGHANHGEYDDDDDDEDGDGGGGGGGDGFPDDEAPIPSSAGVASGGEGGGPAPGQGIMDDVGGLGAGALSMFSDFGRLGGYMSQLNARLRTLLTNIKPSADATLRLIALQELSELLSISTEDTLAGSFQVEGFVRELVRILGGSGGQAAQDEADGEDDEDGGAGDDEDAALAAALSMSAGAAGVGDENLEAQLLACRCLANLMEALPGCGHTLVYHGAIPVLCSKLIEISYIDLAEQTLTTLEKISEEYPSAIVREGGLSALLNYLDFFSIAVQRTALQAASNCCRNASADSFPMIKEVWPIIRNCLSYADQRLVDFAAQCVIRVVESYHRAHAEKLEALVDRDLIRAVNTLLLPAGGSPLVPPGTFTHLIKALATASRASPGVAVALLEADIVTTLYQILTGVLPPQEDRSGQEQGGAEGGQGLGGGVADMAVMQNLAHRPKDQVEEALTLVSELMPPLPKDGTFDHKSYSEKALHRMIKAKAKADRAAARALASASSHPPTPLVPGTPSAAPSRSHTPAGDEDVLPGTSSLAIPDVAAAVDAAGGSGREAAGAGAGAAVDRAELLRANADVVNHFIRLIVPILVDVYAASVSVPLRIKSLTALLKAICFLDSEQLVATLKFVPIASFASSILSSKDHPTLMVGALQMVELLLSKAAAEYRPSFRREGVLHEIETLASRSLPPKAKEKDKDKESKDKDADASPSGGDQSDAAPPPVDSLPGTSKRSHAHAAAIDPEDAYTLRARVIRFKYLTVTGDGAQNEGDSTFASLRALVESLGREGAGEEEMRGALRDMSVLFKSAHSSVSSFELLQSGLVDGLLGFATGDRHDVPIQRRQKIILEELLPRKSEVTSTPFAVLVKKLQESLTRMESFDVSTVNPGIEDSKRSSPSLLARQIRLRLVAAEGSDTPRGCNNIIVSIHAIATFQALNDYLRPRLSGLLSHSMGSSRLSGVLAALTGGRFPPGTIAGRLPDPSSEQFASNAATRPPEPGAAPGSSSTAPPEEPKSERRRSLRLSAKASGNSLSEKAKAEGAPSFSAAPPSAASTATAVAGPGPKEPMREELHTEMAPSETAVNDDDDGHDDYMDGDVDAEVFDEEMDHEDSMAEKTVTLSVADDGSKIEAQTPDGTRVTTPNPLKEADAAPPAASSSSLKPSYAAALKNKPSDWHLEFSMDDHVLPLDMTVYGAVHQHEARKTTGQPLPLNLIWQGVYTVKYKKASGPPATSEARQEGTESPSRARSPGPHLSSMPDDAPHAKILQLLRVLHKLNSQIADQNVLGGQQGLPVSAFVNNKLTAKLTRQLEEPMIVASSCLPDWAVDLPLHFPFLFPLGTRFSFLQSTSFGYARLILKWQSQQNRTQDSSRRDDTFGFLGRLQRQKVRISRKHILESAFKVFELYGSSSSILEVEYFDEVGTGLGPTLEFYHLVSREFARRDLKIWRDADVTHPGSYVHHPNGLFPAPLSPADIASDGGQKRTHVFRVIGQFVAKAMLDSRIIDMTFNKIFLKLILGEEVPKTLSSLKAVDAGLANSLKKLRGSASDDCDAACPKKSEAVIIADTKFSVEDLALDFTIPGYDIELRPNGANIAVTSDNVDEYINEVIDAIIGSGAELQAKAFREGFSKVFPVTDLQAFSADELVILFGSADEDWSPETLTEAMKADHGFNVESRAIRDLIEIMSQYDNVTRRDFLQFITGSPKLPIGGFRALNPPLTVVRKPHEAPLTADDYLPSVMTCVNYLKLPEYSSKDVMRKKLEVAMKEGVGSFHLS
ncbi:hypothetical protein BD410DRAFT_771174 [Rickenella mellea]|uniref:HECT-type E3 ubiquitin transferase n=1 Tax=Rickenella mellea TaxID=50990 RepID=A0A4Y7Q3L8_9AGAM|nr:hypothetical protein BD410DRAFT_771174 [Rickenella mellea]